MMSHAATLPTPPQKGALFISGPEALPNCNASLSSFSPLQHHLNVGERKTDTHPTSPHLVPTQGCAGARASVGCPGRRHWVLGLRRRAPQAKATYRRRSTFFPPHLASCSMNGETEAVPFPLPQEWGWKEASGPWDPLGGGGQRLKQKTHARCVFPSFNLKQKRHRGSKIKTFPPSQTFTPALPLQPPFLPSRT